MSRRIDKEEAAHLQYETEHTEPPKSHSVMLYMGILIAAAFLLLLLAYIMQQRTSSTVQDLQDGINSFQTIDQLVDANQALRDEVAQLKEDQADLQRQLDLANNRLTDATDKLEESKENAQRSRGEAVALDVLNRLRVHYNQGEYRQAQELMQRYPDLETWLEWLEEDRLLEPGETLSYDPLAAYQRLAKLLT